ncbi:hypothetical protein [Allofranklinella schreckenbergeri]|nr:hypothetical protein [Allofranklinella schreckenbergeri]
MAGRSASPPLARPGAPGAQDNSNQKKIDFNTNMPKQGSFISFDW